MILRAVTAHACMSQSSLGIVLPVSSRAAPSLHLISSSTLGGHLGVFNLVVRAERQESRGRFFNKAGTLGSTWTRWTPTLGFHKPLKLFRKTAASKLDQHNEYARFTQFFLAHSARTTAERHYTRPSQGRFDAAISWLREQFLSRRA